MRASLFPASRRMIPVISLTRVVWSWVALATAVTASQTASAWSTASLSMLAISSIAVDRPSVAAETRSMRAGFRWKSLTAAAANPVA